jgi:hypothetical protein
MLGVDFLPLTLILISYFKKRKVDFSPFYVLFFGCALLTQIVTYILFYYFLSTILISNIYVAVEFVLLFFIYRNQNEDVKFRRVQYFAMVSFIVIYCFEFSTNTIVKYSYLFGNIFVLYWVLYSLISALNESKDSIKNTKFEKYFNYGIFFFYSTTFIFYLIIDKLNSENYTVWAFHNILEIITILIFSIPLCTQISRSIS